MFSKMIITLLLLYPILSSGTSNAPRENKYKSNLIRRKLFGIKKVRSSKELELSVIEEVTTVKPSSSLMQRERNRNSFNLLPKELNNSIFGYIIDDYALIRLISKNFCRIYDDFMLILCKKILPNWNDEDAGTTSYRNYRLIPLAHLIYFHIKPLMEHRRVIHKTTSDSRRNAVRLIKIVKKINLKKCLRLTNALLKARIIQWQDVFNLLFSDRIDVVLRAWSLGLTTIACEMALNNEENFTLSIRIENEGILVPIRERQHALSYFMVVSSHHIVDRYIRDSSAYLDAIVSELIYSKFWDILRDFYAIYREKIDLYHHLTVMATNGNIEGLRELRDFALDNHEYLANYAASYGQVEFLREMDALGLLQSGSKKGLSRAVHIAVSKGHTECLEFLISRLGSKYLSFENDKGLMPIHLAAGLKNPEPLQAIIRLYPHYKSRRLISFRTISPLNIAVRKELKLNVIILLDRFPELIYFKDGCKKTALHYSVFNVIDSSVMEMLLNIAPPEIISARNIYGETALQCAAALTATSLSKIEILMGTGHFDPTEHNVFGWTPVKSFKSSNHSVTIPELMTIFHLQSEEQVHEALEIRETLSELLF